MSGKGLCVSNELIFVAIGRQKSVVVHTRRDFDLANEKLFI